MLIYALQENEDANMDRPKYETRIKGMLSIILFINCTPFAYRIYCQKLMRSNIPKYEYKYLAWKGKTLALAM